MPRVIVFKKLRIQNGFCPHEIENPDFSNSFGLKSVFKAPASSQIRLIVEIQLRFQVPSAQHEWGLRLKSFLTRVFPGFRNYQEINTLKINLDVSTVFGKSLLLT